ncbi:MAG: hypothetical protein R2762_10890 [Bryobacteraceae bacterium]
MIPLLLAQFLFLKADGIEAAIRPDKGAEMASLKVMHHGRWVETLYRAMDYSDTPGWTGKAPWLWPATGKGEPLPFHGFARDLPWRVEKKSGDSATLVLTDSGETRKQNFPYGFRLEAEYRVSPSTLHMRLRVTASAGNKEPMPFTAGNHITFRTPLLEGSDPLRMTFTSPSAIEWMKDGGSPNGKQRPRSFSAAPLGDLERDSAISLSGYRGDPFVVVQDPAGLSIRMSHTATSIPAEPVVRFNVWGDAAKGYFSPEPWVGLQDSRRLNQGLTRLALARPGSGTSPFSLRRRNESLPLEIVIFAPGDRVPAERGGPEFIPFRFHSVAAEAVFEMPERPAPMNSELQFVTYIGRRHRLREVAHDVPLMHVELGGQVQKSVCVHDSLRHFPLVFLPRGKAWLLPAFQVLRGLQKVPVDAVHLAAIQIEKSREIIELHLQRVDDVFDLHLHGAV